MHDISITPSRPNVPNAPIRDTNWMPERHERNPRTTLLLRSCRQITSRLRHQLVLRFASFESFGFVDLIMIGPTLQHDQPIDLGIHSTTGGTFCLLGD